MDFHDVQKKVSDSFPWIVFLGGVDLVGGKRIEIDRKPFRSLHVLKTVLGVKVSIQLSGHVLPMLSIMNRRTSPDEFP